MKERIRRRLNQSYGMDELSQHIYYIAMAIFVVTLFYKNDILRLISLILMLVSMMRTLSKKRTKRLRELALYKKFRRNVKAPFQVLFLNVKERKTFKYMRCKECGTILRLPRGRGELEVTCKNCRHKFDART